MSLRWRLIGGIVLLLSALWAATTVWFFFDIRSELREVLDARLASSASMVQGLISRGDLRLPLAAATEALPPAASRPLSLPTELACQLWTLEGRLISAARNTPALPASEIPEGFSNRLVAGEPWRVYALTDRNNGVRIITAERQSLRLALVGDVAKAVSAPFLIVLPATILLVWVAVRRGLVPLERLRRSIVARNAGAWSRSASRGCRRRCCRWSALSTACSPVLPRPSSGSGTLPAMPRMNCALRWPASKPSCRSLRARTAPSGRERFARLRRASIA